MSVRRAMIAFVGEQPLPAVLPALELTCHRLVLLATDLTARVAENVRGAWEGEVEVVLLNNAYALASMEQTIDGFVGASETTILNLTGGTKAMTLAGYRFAERTKTPFVYQESESGKFVLWSYEWQNGELRSGQEEIRTVLPLNDYLRLHGIIDPRKKDCPSDYEGKVTPVVTDLVDELLANMYISDNVEVDLILRTGHRYAVCELHDPTGKNARTKPKIDQLVQATDRPYLGTYTKRILITSKALDEPAKELARARNVEVVVTGDDLDTLNRRISEIMGGRAPEEA